MSAVSLAQGSGGRAMQRLIRELLLKHFDSPILAGLEDCARLPGEVGQLAFTTDSFVVDPVEFPGGDIGSLAVYGSVNDLAVGGATPRYLSFALMLEEGLPLELLERIVGSAAQTAKQAGVQIVCGDTKVVPRGAVDKIFINTSAIGFAPLNCRLSIAAALAGDVVILSGDPGRHGAAIVAARGDLRLEAPIVSDCANLHPLCVALLSAAPDTRCIRDATRGGVATVLNEIAEASAVSVRIEETSIPLNPAVQGLCELLGLDPLYLACEGRLVAVLPADQADAALAALHELPNGTDAAVIATVNGGAAGRVTLRTGFGGERVVDMLSGEQLPRIC